VTGNPGREISELERWVQLSPLTAPLRTTWFAIEEARIMRAEGFEWEHEIRVALPWTYTGGKRTYPVLWLTDNCLEAALSAVAGADVILVSVGAGDIPIQEAGARRTYDFMPTTNVFPHGALGECMRAQLALVSANFEEPPGGGAARFLDFLVDDVRSTLAGEYRMDPNDHALFGFSHGGAFVAYALFAKPGAFARYICGSPTLASCHYYVLGMEEQYAAAYDDLPAHVFLGFGEAEMTEGSLAGWGCVSSAARLAEMLTLRAYPSLRLTAKAFPGESHGTMLLRMLSSGTREVWGSDVFPFRHSDRSNSDSESLSDRAL